MVFAVRFAGRVEHNHEGMGEEGKMIWRETWNKAMEGV
jgi:hypothetical protein